MYSLSLDYIFNRVYDVLLWIKYTWLFTFLRTDPEQYVKDVSYREWDGLRDRGWFDDYFLNLNAQVPQADIKVSLWQRILESTGIRVNDSDRDGIPDITDDSIFDKDNLTKAELKERYEGDYTFNDHLRDLFGIGPKDTDHDGVPNSYEIKHNLDPNYSDTDHDGVFDGQEITQGTDPRNSDTDGDMVLDGRDEAPLNPQVSSIGKDSDNDGVSDVVEKNLGTDTTNRDTDGDGIPDSMDTYPLDLENIGKVSPLDLGSVSQGLHFAIQNPVLSFLSDLLSICTVIILIFFVYTFCRWFIYFLHSLEHFEHHFHHENDHHESHHIIRDSSKHQTIEAGIPGLPVMTEEVIAQPTKEEYKDHPKFAIIQGYMSSASEALWRIGILEADNVLLEILEEKGYQGVGVGEKLKNASFKTVDLAWDAHKIRNRIAHEGSDFELTEREAKRAFMLYESVLRDLKAIR